MPRISYKVKTDADTLKVRLDAWCNTDPWDLPFWPEYRSPAKTYIPVRKVISLGDGQWCEAAFTYLSNYPHLHWLVMQMESRWECIQLPSIDSTQPELSNVTLDGTTRYWAGRVVEMLEGLIDNLGLRYPGGGSERQYAHCRQLNEGNNERFEINIIRPGRHGGAPTEPLVPFILRTVYVVPVGNRALGAQARIEVYLDGSPLIRKFWESLTSDLITENDEAALVKSQTTMTRDEISTTSERRGPGRPRIEDDPIAQRLFNETEELRKKEPSLTRAQVAARKNLSEEQLKRMRSRLRPKTEVPPTGP